MKCFIVFLGHC